MTGPVLWGAVMSGLGHAESLRDGIIHREDVFILQMTHRVAKHPRRDSHHVEVRVTGSGAVWPFSLYAFQEQSCKQKDTSFLLSWEEDAQGENRGRPLLPLPRRTER